MPVAAAAAVRRPWKYPFVPKWPKPSLRVMACQRARASSISSNNSSSNSSTAAASAAPQQQQQQQ
eukprot:11182078-Lingulodinium_polyedra.AAC.1